MRKLLLTTLLLSALLTMRGGDYLILYTKSGETIGFRLEDKPVMEFADSTVTIGNRHFTFDECDKYIIGTEDQLGIMSPEIERIPIVNSDGTIVLPGILSADDISIYDTKGVRYPVRSTITGDNTTIDCSMLTSGIYLLTAEGHTLKFAKR